VNEGNDVEPQCLEDILNRSKPVFAPRIVPETAAPNKIVWQDIPSRAKAFFPSGAKYSIKILVDDDANDCQFDVTSSSKAEDFSNDFEAHVITPVPKLSEPVTDEAVLSSVQKALEKGQISKFDGALWIPPQTVNQVVRGSESGPIRLKDIDSKLRTNVGNTFEENGWGLLVMDYKKKPQPLLKKLLPVHSDHITVSSAQSSVDNYAKKEWCMQWYSQLAALHDSSRNPDVDAVGATTATGAAAAVVTSKESKIESTTPLRYNEKTAMKSNTTSFGKLNHDYKVAVMPFEEFDEDLQEFFRVKVLDHGDWTPIFKANNPTALLCFEFHPNYMRDFVFNYDVGTKGTFLEYHPFPHLYMAGNKESYVRLILGREMDGELGDDPVAGDVAYWSEIDRALGKSYMFIDVTIPYGKALWAKPMAIHNPSASVGIVYGSLELKNGREITGIMKTVAGEMVQPFGRLATDDEKLHDSSITRLSKL